MAGSLSPEQFWAHMTQLDDRMRASAHLLPLYGLAGWSDVVMIGDWLWEDDRLTTVGLLHGGRAGHGVYIHVRTTVNDPASVVANLLMPPHLLLRDGDGSHVLRQPFTTMPSTAGSMMVNGRLEDVERWSEGERWYVAAWLNQYGLVVEGRGIASEQIDLVSVDDIEPYLAGRHAHIRALRGEV